MQEFFYANFEHALAFLILFSRLADIGTTYFLTPNLKLEANPIVRKFGWPFAWITTIPICMVPYFWTSGAIIIIVAFLLVAYANSRGLWLARTIGEEKYLEFMISASGQAKPRQTVALLLIPGLLMVILGIVVMLFYPNPSQDWGFYISMGIFGYALVISLYSPLSFFRLRKQYEKNSQTHPQSMEANAE